MRIDILEDYAQIRNVETEKEVLLIGYGNLLNLLHGNRLNDDLFKQIRVEKGEVYLNKFWAKTLCEKGGISKKEFIEIQVIAFEMREACFKNEIDFRVGTKKYYPNITDRNYKYDDTKKTIKRFKREFNTSAKDCVFGSIAAKDYHSKLCCLCGNKDILILRRDQ